MSVVMKERRQSTPQPIERMSRSASGGKNLSQCAESLCVVVCVCDCSEVKCEGVRGVWKGQAARGVCVRGVGNREGSKRGVWRDVDNNIQSTGCGRQRGAMQEQEAHCVLAVYWDNKMMWWQHNWGWLTAMWYKTVVPTNNRSQQSGSSVAGWLHPRCTHRLLSQHSCCKQQQPLLFAPRKKHNTDEWQHSHDCG